MVSRMRAEDLREFNQLELEEKLREIKEELFNLRFQNVTQQLDNPMRIKIVRRNIARVKTVMRERELGIKRA